MRIAFLLVFGMAISSATPVRIGAVYASTGAFAALDEPSWLGAQAAVALANKSGGVRGERVELVRISHDGTAESVARAVRAALEKDPSIAAFVGASDAGIALAAGREAKRAGRVFVTSGATFPLLPTQAGPGFFLACFGDNVQAAAAAEWLLHGKKAGKVCVLYDSSQVSTRLLRRYFEAAFTHGGGAVLGSLAYRTGEPVGMPAGLDGCDAVFLAAATAGDAGTIVTKLRAFGFAGIIVGSNSFDVARAWEDNPLSEKVYYTTHAFPAKGPGAADAAVLAGLRSNYRGGTPGAFSGLGFDATRLVLAGLADGGKGLVARIQNGVPLAGVTGPIAFQRGSRIPVKPVAIVDAARPRQALTQITPAYVPSP